jgi:CRISPR/Cas system CSM-associated protein Csm3 (group 7 of RAMP superfamily)
MGIKEAVEEFVKYAIYAGAGLCGYGIVKWGVKKWLEEFLKKYGKAEIDEKKLEEVVERVMKRYVGKKDGDSSSTIS